VPLSVKLRRYGYQIAYVGLRIWSFTVRPRLRGVKCILTNEGRVLLVRHTYGPSRWDLPGGTAKRGERPSETARREMAEELGVTLDGLADLGCFTGRIDRRSDTMHCFHAEIAGQKLTLERAEIAEARWFQRDGLPPNVGLNVRAMVALVGRAGLLDAGRSVPSQR
jgi:8-oxo-dGTP pyrophosphatase MutT (NUDIX family)